MRLVVNIKATLPRQALSLHHLARDSFALTYRFLKISIFIHPPLQSCYTSPWGRSPQRRFFGFWYWGPRNAAEVQ